MSIRRKLALFGRPISGPVSASTSSTVKSNSFGELADFGAEEAADAIGDEVGRILARHHAFAEVQIAECRDPVQDVAARFRPGDHFGQVQVARRIEEVRAQKMLPELAIEAFGDAGQGNAAGVGGDDRARRAQRRRRGATASA